MNLLPDARKSRTRDGKTDRTVLNRFKGAIPRTKAGRIKGRLTRDEKLHALDPFSDSKATEDRLDRFQELFGFWRLRPALTYTSEEHLGCWFTRKKGMLYLEDVARHLLANRLYPARNPQWVAPRSGRTTTFFCIDRGLKCLRGGGLGARHEDVELLDGLGAAIFALGELDLLATDFDVPPRIELTEPRFRFTHDKTSGSW